MDKEHLKKLQREWFKENAPLGRELGYPECCIKEFCDQPPALLKERERNHQQPSKDDMRRYKAGFINGEFTGFIPCCFHAKQITTGKISLSDLIVGRNEDFPPFPQMGK